MNWFQKNIAVTLSVLMLCSLASCGEEKVDESALPSDTEVNVSDVVADTQIDTTEVEVDTETAEETEVFEEPFDSNADLFEEKLGRSFGRVRNAENIGSHFDSKHQYAAIEFEDNVNHNIVGARMMRATENCNPADIFAGSDLDYENAVEQVIYGDITATVVRGAYDDVGEFAAAFWLDTDANMVFACIVAGENMNFDYVGELFYSSES